MTLGRRKLRWRRLFATVGIAAVAISGINGVGGATTITASVTNPSLESDELKFFQRFLPQPDNSPVDNTGAAR